jgi:hypothetical protein
MKNWRISVINGLSAHFKQPVGKSRAGIDWMVHLECDGETKQLFVRSYKDETGDMQPAQIASAIANFIQQKFNNGWDPEQYKGNPGEIVLPAQVSNKPRWKFW